MNNDFIHTAPAFGAVGCDWRRKETIMDDFGNFIDYSEDNEIFDQMLCSLDDYGFASGQVWRFFPI